LISFQKINVENLIGCNRPYILNCMNIESATKVVRNFINNIKLINPNVILAIATVLLLVVSFLQYQANLELSDSNEKLTNITTEYYRYHSPEVSLIQGNVAKLYVLRDGNSTTYFTVLGFASVYNSALSDDIALVRQENTGNTYKLFDDTKITIYGVQGNVITQIYEVNIPINDSISIESTTIPIPIIPGEPPKEIPLLMTYRIENTIELNTTVELEIIKEISNIEVIHPNTKKIIANFTALDPTNITYIMGKDMAIVEKNGRNVYNIEVRYTENKETYQNWKRTFLRPYGLSSLTI